MASNLSLIVYGLPSINIQWKAAILSLLKTGNTRKLSIVSNSIYSKTSNSYLELNI